MSIVVEGGDWKRGRRVRIQSALLGGPTAISLPTGLAFGMERIAKANLACVRLVTEQMRNEALNKVGAGVVGGVLLGPLGLIAGAVIGRGQTSQLVILETTDGRSALLRCKPSDLSRLLALGVGTKTPTPSAATQQLASPQSTRLSARQLRASTPTRWALEGVGWLALFLVIGISMTTAPLIWFGLCVLAVLLGGLIWWRTELRARFGIPRAIGLAAIGAFFLLPVLFYSIAGAPSASAPEVSAARETSTTPSVSQPDQPTTQQNQEPAATSPATPLSAPQGLQVTEEAFEAQGREWPFDVSSGTVGCEMPMRALWFQAPDGRRFALNGTASSHLGLPWPDPIWLQDMQVARIMEQQFGRWPSPEESGRLSISDTISLADRTCEP